MGNKVKQKSGKEKSIKPTSFSPFRPGALSVRDEAQACCIKYFRMLCFEEPKAHF